MKQLEKYLIVLFTVLGFSCEDTIDQEIRPQESDLLVVEGILTNQRINHRIRLSHPHQEINGDPLPASGAFVNIAEGQFENDEPVFEAFTPLTEFPEGSGEYYTPPFRAAFGRVYFLLIEYQGREYFAFDASVPAEPLPEIQLQRASEEFPAYRLLIEGSGSEANYVDHFITWEGTGFCSGDTLCEGRVVYYDLKTVDVHEIFKPDKTDFLFPVNSVIVRTKYSVNDRYRTFLRSVLSETEWRGGIFDIQRANAPTNLSEGAIGFFAVSTAISDTTIVTE